MADRKNIARHPSAARHILSYAQDLSRGGVEAALLRLAARWAAEGRRVTIVVGTPPAPEAVPDGVAIDAIGNGSYGALLRALPGRVRHHAPDVIFCAGNHYTGIAAWTRARLGPGGPPIVGKVSNALVRPDLGWAEPFYGLWLHRHPRFLDAVVAMTTATGHEAMAAMRMPAARVRVIANPPALSSREGGPLLPGRYLIGVGRLQPQKRWDRAVAALAGLPDMHLAILGDGPLRAALGAQAAALGVGEQLHLPGHVANPMPAIRHAAALVLTSDYEGVPGVVREALSVGTPVVVTASSVALPEIVATPLHGTIVPRDDPAALVAALSARLAPDAPRPAPILGAGDPAGDYLSLFDSLVSSRS